MTPAKPTARDIHHPADIPSPRELYSIQVLRGVAAVLVMFYHYAHYLGATLPGRDLGFVMFAGGYVGVDVFFYISGFIIVYSTRLKRHADPVDFSIRRFFRVVPLAQLATLVYFIIVSAKPSGRLLLQSLLFVPRGYIDPPKFGYPVVPQEWTLPYELFFYALFAATLAFTQRHRIAVATAALVASVVGFQWIMGGVFTLHPNAVYPSPAYHGPIPAEYLGILGNPILLEFVLGMILAVAYVRLESRLRTQSLALAERIAGLALIGFFVVGYLSRDDPGNGVLDRGTGAACLVVGALLLEISFPAAAASRCNGRCLSFFLWLGTISYPLYLVHYGIAEWILRRICSIFLGIGVNGLWGEIALIATSLAVASLAHVYVERPFIRLGKYIITLRAKPRPIQTAS